MPTRRTSTLRDEDQDSLDNQLLLVDEKKAGK
jgi:hypothetical protein